jgi:hypothetical protein
MKRLLLILILMTYQASATVEDPGGDMNGGTGSNWPNPVVPSLPTYLPSACPDPILCLEVSLDLTGPELKSKEANRDAGYITQGKILEFLVNVKNDGPNEVEAELGVSSKSCPPEWFSWTTESLVIPSGSTRSKVLQVRPDINAVPGRYDIIVDASAKCCESKPGKGSFTVQVLDYASETAISGTGQFRLDKNVRSMNSGIKSHKDIVFSGSVDAMVKNEYLVDQSKGNNPNFEEKDAVDNYNALVPGDSLVGTESFKSSAVFGGVGAKVQESYNVLQMEFKNQDFNLHQTGSRKKTAEFSTADNFTGFYLIDAKQTIPGQRSLKEHEEYLGSFEINRRLLFRNQPTFNAQCFEGDCANKPSIAISPRGDGGHGFTSPCLSGSCSKFTKALNAFSESV